MLKLLLFVSLVSAVFFAWSLFASVAPFILFFGGILGKVKRELSSKEGDSGVKN